MTAAAAFVALLLPFAPRADAQAPVERIVAKGPSVPAVYAFAQSSDGALWMGEPQGVTRLEVIAANGFGVWSKEKATRRFGLLRPLHRNPMVWVTFAIAAALATWTLCNSRRRRRQRQLLLLRQERDRMSRDLHDGMGQGFSSIGSHLEAIEESLSQTPQDLEVLRRLLGQTREVLDRSQAAAQQAVWDLRDLQDQTPDLGASLQAMVRAQMLGRSEPKVTLNVGTFEGTRSLFAEQELCLLAKEALTNALRHSGAKNVLIETDRDTDFIHLSVSDDGVGLTTGQQEVAAESGHFGILGMQERVRRLGGTISIVSPPGGGTEIVVAVPTSKIIHP